MTRNSHTPDAGLPDFQMQNPALIVDAITLVKNLIRKPKKGAQPFTIFLTKFGRSRRLACG
jgi:hypothetical protein